MQADDGKNQPSKLIAPAILTVLLIVGVVRSIMADRIESRATAALATDETDKTATPTPVTWPPAELRTTDIRQGRIDGEYLEVVTVSATSLFREYEQNEVATDMRLKGKIVEIHGAITGVNKDFWDSVYVTLRTPNQFMDASVRPIKSDIDKIARLRKGQGVAFRCQTMQRFMGSPSGSNCALVD